MNALVFDLDGTIAETAGDLHLILAEVLAEAGLAAPPLSAVRGMIGDGARALIEKALVEIGRPADPDFVDGRFARFRARYAEEPCRASALYPGARELLTGLAAQDVALGLCTNKPQGATDGLLKALEVDHLFGSAIGGDVLGVRKPDGRHLAAVLAALSVPPARAAMVGDSRNDLLTARALGIPCILVSFGYTSVPTRELGADAVIDRLDQLPEALAGLPVRA
jgi:phosphoglycolate phosphatase